MKMPVPIRDAAERFEKAAQRWIDDAALPPPGRVPEEVFHYTDAAGLLGMLSSDQVWLTDSRFLNDSTECTHLNKLVQDYLKAELGNHRGSNDTDRQLLTTIIDCIVQPSKDNTFVFSLSPEADDLSQWRGYAREGSGFTVGFDGADLHRAALDRSTEFLFSRVEYSRRIQQSSTKRILDEFRKQLDTDIRQHADHAAGLIEEAANHYAWCIDSRSAFSKHESFKNEREWRIATYLRDGEPGIKVRTSGLALVPYYPVAISGENTKLPIKSIGIGPGFRDPHIVEAVAALCRQTGYDPTIYQANTPYRRG